MILLKRISRYLAPVQCRMCGQRFSPTDKIDFIEQAAGITRREAIMLAKNCVIQKLDLKDLIFRYQKLEDLGIENCRNKHSIVLLKSHHVTVQNHWEVLNEAGFIREKITTKLLTEYFDYMKKSITSLKNIDLIRPETNVMKSMLSCVNIKEEHLPQILDDDFTIHDIKSVVLRVFLKSTFGMKDDILHSTSPLLLRLKNKSLATICQNIKISHERIGISFDRIARNSFLLYQHPESTLRILDEVKTIGGVDAAIILNSFPKIVSSSSENLVNIIKTLEEYEIPSSQIGMFSRLFTMSHQTIRNNLEELFKLEHAKYCVKNPKFLEPILCRILSTENLRQMEEMNIRISSVSLNLLTDPKAFEKYMKYGPGKSLNMDLVRYLEQEVGFDKEDLSRVRKHLFFRWVPLITVARNVNFLSNYFSTSDIRAHPWVLLYPDRKVRGEYHSLESKEGIEACKENGVVKHELKLVLITYFLEKDTNFTFEGVWGDDLNGNYPTEGADMSSSKIDSNFRLSSSCN